MKRRVPPEPRKWPRGVTLYIGAVTVAAVIASAVSWSLVGPPDDAVAVAILLVLGLLSVLLREPDVGAKVTFSFLSIIVISSTVIIGPAGSALVGGLSMAFERGHRPGSVRMFNASMVAAQGAVGGLVYWGARGIEAREFSNVTGAIALLLHVGLPLMAADVTQMLVNAILLSVVVRLSSGVPARRFLVQIVGNSGLAYVGYGVIGFLFVILWVPADVGPFSAALILAPLMVARWAFVQYGDEQRAHERALSALVTAVETKDPFAAGHSSRVARLAEWMSEPLSMGAQEVQSLRFAAMLHDVGKVGVPARTLRGRHGATRADVETLTRHPEFGVELVRQIGFLSESLDGIRHHHERWDGGGYPDGLRGEHIPLSSRVIAVADAFDALTTPRAERPALGVGEALTEIEQRQGRQFDPAVVAALTTALERHAWATDATQADGVGGMRGYLDHDDPIAWEQVWQVVQRQQWVARPGASPTAREGARPHTIRPATAVAVPPVASP